MSEFLEGTKESKIITDEGLLINSSGKLAILIYKRRTEKVELVNTPVGRVRQADMRVWATMLRLRSVEGVFSTSKTKSGFLIMLIQNLRGTLLDFQEWTMCSVCSPPPAKATLLSKRSKSHLTAGGKDSSQVVLVVFGEPPPRPLPSLTVSMVVKKSSMNFLTVPLTQ